MTNDVMQLTEETLKMVRDQVLVVIEEGESESDAGIVISASVRLDSIHHFCTSSVNLDLKLCSRVVLQYLFFVSCP